MKYTMSLHPNGLLPLEAVKAWHYRHEEDLSWPDIQSNVLNAQGQTPSIHAVRNSVNMVERMRKRGDDVPKTNYGNCGRKDKLTPAQKREIVKFVSMCRHKRFCTTRYVRKELKLTVSTRTIQRVLNVAGFHWRRVPKVHGLSEEDLQKREAFVMKYGGKSAEWWEANLNLDLDGVTLTMAPKPLSKRQKHASQRITSIWLKDGERLDNDLHTFNRYGIQLGTKVSLWGGFTGGGKFSLRLWTPKPKMTKGEWESKVPLLKRAVDKAEAEMPERKTKRAKVWHDNEKFLLCPKVYRANGLDLVRFPPNSGDLNPIETVWARLRRELAVREIADIENGVTITVAQFHIRRHDKVMSDICHLMLKCSL